MAEQLLILEFNSVEEAIEFAKEINPESIIYKTMLDEDDVEDWIFVLAVCDICGAKDCFFAPAGIYDDGITGCECFNCGNMSIYPKEGSWEDE